MEVWDRRVPKNNFANKAGGPKLVGRAQWSAFALAQRRNTVGAVELQKPGSTNADPSCQFTMQVSSVAYPSGFWPKKVKQMKVCRSQGAGRLNGETEALGIRSRDIDLDWLQHELCLPALFAQELKLGQMAHFVVPGKNIPDPGRACAARMIVLTKDLTSSASIQNAISAPGSKTARWLCLVVHDPSQKLPQKVVMYVTPYGVLMRTNARTSPALVQSGGKPHHELLNSSPLNKELSDVSGETILMWGWGKCRMKSDLHVHHIADWQTFRSASEFISIRVEGPKGGVFVFKTRDAASLSDVMLTTIKQPITQHEHIPKPPWKAAVWREDVLAPHESFVREFIQNCFGDFVIPKDIRKVAATQQSQQQARQGESPTDGITSSATKNAGASRRSSGVSVDSIDPILGGIDLGSVRILQVRDSIHTKTGTDLSRTNMQPQNMSRMRSYSCTPATDVQFQSNLPRSNLDHASSPNQKSRSPSVTLVANQLDASVFRRGEDALQKDLLKKSKVKGRVSRLNLKIWV